MCFWENKALKIKGHISIADVLILFIVHANLNHLSELKFGSNLGLNL